jgi:hypothetical protein
VNQDHEARVDDVGFQISPELALVDPVLATAARQALEEPSDCLAPRARAPRAAVAPSPGASEGPLERDRAASERSRLERVLFVALAVVLAGLALVPFLAFIPPGESSKPQILPVEDDVTQSTGRDFQPTTPDARTGGEEPPQPSTSAATLLGDRITIRWPAPQRPVAFYNLVLLVNGKRFDRWPIDTVFTFTPPSSAKREGRAGAVHYQWWVYPGRRSGDAIRFGPLIASGSASSDTALR